MGPEWKSWHVIMAGKSIAQREATYIAYPDKCPKSTINATGPNNSEGLHGIGKKVSPG